MENKNEVKKPTKPRNTQENKEQVLEPLKEFVNQSSVKHLNSSLGKGSLLSIVKSTNGTRLSISKSVNEKLGYPSEIYFGCENEYLILFNSQDTGIEGKKLPENKRGKLTIYDTTLVNGIIEEFHLDYSEVTSKSFVEEQYEDKGRTVLYVRMV